VGSRQPIFNPVVLLLLLCGDVAFMLLHVSNRLVPRNPLLSLAVDGGYSEVFQYIKEYWTALLFFAMSWRAREVLFAAWALLFTYLLCDDALTIHESLGRVIATRWDLVPVLGIRAGDFGELMVSAIAGALFLVLIGGLYVRSSEMGKSVSRDLSLLLAVLVFFGVVVDAVHLALQEQRVHGLTVFEDSGEMVAMSLIASYAVRLWEQRGAAAGLLWRLTTEARVSRTQR
jgi:hypothetical protein